MTSPERPGRSFGALLLSQLRTTGLAIQREAALAAAGLALACLLAVTTSLRYHDRVHALPEILLATLPVALLLPWAVWRGDPAFGRAYLWTLPVRRQQAAAAKVAAGALWLVLILIVALIALFVIAAATGGSIGIEEMRLVGPFDGSAAAARIPWATPAWMWLVPFGGALTLYLASSAALLGLRYPMRWLGGAAVALILFVVLALNMAPHSPLSEGLGRFAEALVAGRWGLDFALTGGVAALAEEVDVPGPGSVNLWRALPTAGAWLGALAVWLGAALLALALALRRHWER